MQRISNSFLNYFVNSGLFSELLTLFWTLNSKLFLSKPDNTITNGNINYNLANSNNLKDYLRVDFSATKDLKISDAIDAKIGASVWNLLNTKNIINKYYTLDTDENITKVENESLGITPNVSLRVYF